MRLRSAALKTVTLLPFKVRDQDALAVEAAAEGAVESCSHPPLIVATTLPVLAWTTVIELLLRFGTQMLVPSNTGYGGARPTLTVWRMLPPASSLQQRPGTVIGDPDVRAVVENAAGCVESRADRVHGIGSAA